MKITFSDQSHVVVGIENTPLANTYTQAAKHLQHVALPFREWDDPFYLESVTFAHLTDQLAKYASGVGLTVDKSQCNSQQYLNAIHKIYEKNYNGSPAWLDFHEHIHMCENYSKPQRPWLHLDYREKAGPLIKKVEPNWVTNLTTQVKSGDVYLAWAELGKTPYVYWKDQEPNDIARLCELAKPWQYVRPKLFVALKDFDLLDGIDVKDFRIWWQQYKDTWCQHWNIPDWTVEHMHGVAVIGKTDQAHQLTQKLKSHIYPTGIKIV